MNMFVGLRVSLHLVNPFETGVSKLPASPEFCLQHRTNLAFVDGAELPIQSLVLWQEQNAAKSHKRDNSGYIYQESSAENDVNLC
jgi:hypothetical protein